MTYTIYVKYQSTITSALKVMAKVELNFLKEVKIQGQGRKVKNMVQGERPCYNQSILVWNLCRKLKIFKRRGQTSR